MKLEMLACIIPMAVCLRLLITGSQGEPRYEASGLK